MYQVFSIGQRSTIECSQPSYKVETAFIFYLHFTNKEIEAQKGYKTYSRSGGWWASELDREARLSGFKFCDFTTILCYFSSVQKANKPKQSPSP